MAIKDDYIKIRVSKEQKALFKDIAKKKNITFANEKSVLLISAEHCRMEKLAGFQIVTCLVCITR